MPGNCKNVHLQSKSGCIFAVYQDIEKEFVRFDLTMLFNASLVAFVENFQNGRFFNFV